MTGLEIVLEYLPIKIKKIINEQKSKKDRNHGRHF